MRIPRVYIAEQLSPDSTIELSPETSHYLLKVLRMNEGRELIAFDGCGGEYPATISSATKKIATISTGEKVNEHRESPLNTHLAIGLSRGERFDWVLQKATELGVTSITPLFTERTEVKLTGDRLQKKYEHWKQISISACEQCQRNFLPILNNATHFSDYIATESSELKFVLHHRSDQSLSEYGTPDSVSLLIGPEGGLSEEEIQQAENSGFRHLTLGPRILRTETAPIVSLSLVQSLWGDL